MRSTLKICLVAAGTLLVNIALAQDDITAGDFKAFQDYVTKSNIAPACQTCHQVDKKMVGPSYNAVALKYKGDDKAAAALEKKVLEGGSGVWGAVPMTPNPTAKDHAAKLVKWILALDPKDDAKKAAEDEIKAAPPKK